jgi:hypothetical protein
MHPDGTVKMLAPPENVALIIAVGASAFGSELTTLCPE